MGTAPRSSGPIRMQLIAACVYTILAALILAAVMLPHAPGRAVVIESAKRELDLEAAQAAQNTRNAVAALDAVLNAVRDRITITDCVTDECLNPLLQDLASTLGGYTRVIMVAGQDGIITAGSRKSGQGIGIDVGDREYVTAHRENPDLGLYIGAPVKSRVNNEWSIPLSRAVRRSDGQLQAVVVGSIEPRYFRGWTHVDDKAGTGPEAMIQRVTLVDDSGTVLATVPDAEELIGRDFRDVPALAFFDGLDDTRPSLVHSGPQDTSVLAASRRLAPDYPFKVLVAGWPARALESFAAQHRARLFIALAALGLLALVALLTFHFLEKIRTANKRLTREVDERGRAQQNLSQTTRRLKEAQRVAKMGDWDWDPVTNTVTWSDNLYAIMELDPALPPPDFEGQVLLYHPEDREQFRSTVLAALDNREAFTLELRRTRTDGTQLHLISEGRIETDGQGEVTRMYGTVLDITERKEMELKLKEAQAFLKTAMDCSPAGIAIADAPDGKLRYVNAAGLGIRRASKEEVVNGVDAQHYVESWQIMHFDGTPYAPEEVPLARAVLFGETCDRQFVIRTPDREDRIVWAHAAPVLDEHDQVIAGIVVFPDITAHKRAEEKLVAAKQQAEAANQAKSAFLANMSHEIRTPLNGIVGMLQLLAICDPDQEQADYLDKALAASWRLTNLLSDILDLSRIEAGKLDTSKTEFDLNEVFQAVSDLSALNAKNKGIDYGTTIDPRLPTHLVGDPARLQQILFNLVGNAIKFTDSGHVTMEAYALPHALASRQRVLFTVSDSGRGMSDKQQENIFEPFTQVHSGFSKEHEGAGLGLSIVKRLVELMGGTIALASTPGEGTDVHLCLVFDLPASDSREEQAEPEASAPSGHRILLAEDDAMSQSVFARMLERKGHAVTIAGNGQEALEALSQAPFDLILMDIKMPVMDGCEATRRIRSDTSGAFDPAIPIIAITAYAMEGDRDRFLTEGADDYVTKPLGAMALDAAIERAMQQRSREPGEGAHPHA